MYQDKNNSIKKIGMISLFAVAFLLFATSAWAQTATNALNVTANVQANCRISAVTDVAFGVYDPTDPVANQAGAGGFNLACVTGTNYDYYIAGARNMTGGTNGDTLSFELYSNAGRTTVFESATPGTTGTAASNAATPVNVYGEISALQNVSVDNYTGSVTITVDYN